MNADADSPLETTAERWRPSDKLDWLDSLE